MRVLQLVSAFDTLDDTLYHRRYYPFLLFQTGIFRGSNHRSHKLLELPFLLHNQRLILYTLKGFGSDVLHHFLDFLEGVRLAVVAAVTFIDRHT